jgi:class 3 adenylate cyclase
MEVWMMTSKTIFIKLGLDTVVAVTLLDQLGAVLSPLLVGVGIALGNVIILLITHYAKKFKVWLREHAEKLKKYTGDDVDKLIDDAVDKMDDVVDEAIDHVAGEIRKKTGGK